MAQRGMAWHRLSAKEYGIYRAENERYDPPRPRHRSRRGIVSSPCTLSSRRAAPVYRRRTTESQRFHCDPPYLYHFLLLFILLLPPPSFFSSSVPPFRRIVAERKGKKGPFLPGGEEGATEKPVTKQIS